jgi:hypothetical protein
MNENVENLSASVWTFGALVFLFTQIDNLLQGLGVRDVRGRKRGF